MFIPSWSGLQGFAPQPDPTNRQRGFPILHSRQQSDTRGGLRSVPRRDNLLFFLILSQKSAMHHELEFQLPPTDYSIHATQHLFVNHLLAIRWQLCRGAD